MNKHRFIALFAACCLVPLLFAQLVLQQGWFTAGQNSKGAWLAEEVQLLSATPANAAHWRLVYLVPSPCTEQCVKTQHLMQQIFTALGRKQDQLSLVLLTEEAVAQSENLQLESPFQLQQGSFQGLPAGRLLLVEHQGLALLEYSLPEEQQQLLLAGKAVMADLQKLMKFDRGPV